MTHTQSFGTITARSAIHCLVSSGTISFFTTFLLSSFFTSSLLITICTEPHVSPLHSSLHCSIPEAVSRARMVVSPRHVRRKNCLWFVRTGALPLMCPSLAVAPAAVAYQLVVFQCVCVCARVFCCARCVHTHTHSTHWHGPCVWLTLPYILTTNRPRTHVSIGSNIKHHEPCTNCSTQSA